MTWTWESIQAMLQASGWPVSCGVYPGERTPTPPFIIWDASGADFYADDCNFAPFADIMVELYTSSRDRAAEAALESILRNNDIAWDKSTDYMERERLYTATYTSTIAMTQDD